METEGEKFEPHRVWQAAWQRFERKALAKQEGVKTVKLRAESRGDDTPDLSNRGKPLEPIAELTEDGKLKWNDSIVSEIKRLADPPKK